MILDTQFLVDLLRGKDDVVKNKAKELDEKFETKAISTITLMELWRGAMQSINQEKEKKKIEELLQSLFIYPFHEKEAKIAGEIEAGLIKKGKLIDLEDIMIAATVFSRNEVVLTRNVKHFNEISGLRIEFY